ncbi:GGDEF domain-containing protein [Desulfovibrio sp. TomC]|uniref:GGDEF domain-containing protein n=1 Tax=Desulfovibrio sp. TomC TaxID=1562888 RepID=UPI0005754A8B|nr:diguanylate cyclase [Desulfovibrio sp. TomC]KHK02136.1 diguanylate cyclase (GGDEF domain) with PAS/PAC sensor [Desulfovibrio sp. TomC]
MQRWSFWDNCSITAKLWLSFAVLFLFFAMASVAGFVGLAVVRGAETDIVANMDIRGRVLELEGQLEKARRLYRDFVLHAPVIGFAQAQERYNQPALAVAARVIALSEDLRRAIAALAPGSAIARHKVDMNFFTSTAKRFSQTLLSENELVTLIGDPETGLDAQLAAALAGLAKCLDRLPQAAYPLRETDLLVRQYQITRQRPVMQAASNKIDVLRRLVATEAGRDPALQAEAARLFEAFDRLAARLLDAVAATSANANDFALQAKAVDPISEEFKRITAADVARAKQRILWASRIAGGIILVSALLGFGSVILVGRMLHNAITSKLVTLTQYASSVRDGNLDAAIAVSGGDELGILAESLRAMNRRIHDLVVNLEDKVRQRTRELAQKNHELDEKNRVLAVLSLTDRLTGLCNRRKLDQSLAAEWRRAERYGTAFTVIMIDIDNFKDVNDAFGHGIGDVVLVRISDILMTAVRDTDIVGRWGGEEFLLICPETAVEEARNLAETLRREIRETDFPGVGYLTASFGVADYEADVGPAMLVARADEAMYRAKESGRNQVVIAPSSAVGRT